jgi:uncharacterized delta-60 repeat protein
MNPARKSSALSRCVLETLESRQLMASAAGVLDSSFSGDGKATVEFGPGQTLFAADVAVQADGKTVIAGALVPDNLHFAVARLNFDGTPDLAFGHQGIALIAFDGRTDVVTKSVAIQSDGKIVVAGSLDFSKWAVARFLPNGQPDTSFDNDGKQTIDLDGSAKDIVIQSDGKIVLAGDHDDSGFLSGPDYDFAIARLNPNGKLDNTFDGNGKKGVGFGDDDEGRAAAIDSRGRIVVVGQTFLSDGNNSAFGVTRVNSNGTTDTTFGNGGTVKTLFPGHPSASADAVVIQPSGKIVVAGNTHDSASGSFALARYLPNGRLDTTFGIAGTGLVEFPFTSKFDKASDLINSADGGIVVAGTADGKFALAGLTVDGRLNDSFGVGGKVITDFGSAGGVGFGNVAIAKGPGRRFVAAGGSHFKTARFLDNGANLVSALAINAPVDLLAAEGSPPRAATFIVDRNETLPVPTRVFFNISGSAQQAQFLRPGVLLSGDYTLQGITVPGALSNGLVATTRTGGSTTADNTPFVVIPAGQSFTRITLTPVDDTRLEPAETAQFEILKRESYQNNPLAHGVVVNIADNDSVHINFQPPGSTPSGFLADTGLIFGARAGGLSYGWDADNTANARARNSTGSPDLRYDTLIKMQDGVDRSWEMAVPNGMYTVRIVAGDPSNTDSVYKLNLEGQLALSGTPSGDTRWFRSTVNVQVRDGRLTLSNAVGSKNNKIAFLDIKGAAPGAVPGPVAANLPVQLFSAATASLWHRTPNGLFSDNQIDEPLWA